MSAAWRARSALVLAGGAVGHAGAHLAVGDLVPDAPDRDDRRRVAELAAELADMHVHRPRVARERVAPHSLEQLVTREDDAPVVEQLPEEVELLGRELDLLLPHLHLAPAGVDVQLAVRERPRLGRRRSVFVRRRIDFTRATSSRGLNGFVM